MKTIILSIFLFFPFLLLSQIAFDGDKMPISRLNTPEGQNYLVMSPFGKVLAFTEERGGSKNEDNEFRVYDSDMLEGNWQIHIFPDWLNEKGILSPIGFDSDGGLYYSQTIYDKGTYRSKVKRASSGGKVEEVSIPFMKNKSPIQSGSLSADGQFMILSLESNNTKGVEDLYVVKKKSDGSWSSVSNLGANINTPFQEITPFLAADNKTLFFATNGRGGEGSFDIFYAQRLDESWRNWSTPVNMGSAVNTTGAETSFSFIDQWAYFVSSQDSDGYGDIMRIKIKEPEIVPDSTNLIIANEPIDEEVENVIVSTNEETGLPDVIGSLITLKIVDPETDAILSAELINGDNREVSEEGVFSIDSLSDAEVEIKSKGYLPKLVLLNELGLGENIIEMSSISVGHIIQLDHVLFHRGTANMVDGSQKELNLVVEVMNDNPDMKILLKGHTDNNGDQVLNRKLSQARVKTVREYLLGQGVNAYRIRGKGYGGMVPIASNATEETRKLNRRVEFEVLEN
ncbi:MAG: OmpA family protein [Ekhidna sp.]